MYVLKAETEYGIYFYLNQICVTQQIQTAKKFPTYEDAEDVAGELRQLFYYESPKITVEKVEG